MNTAIKTYPPRDDLFKIRAFIERAQGREGRKLDLTRMCQTTGLPYKSMSLTFRKGDMRLSRAEDISRAYGATLRLLFPAREETYWINDEIRQSPVTEEDMRSGNLMGLKKYMGAMKISANRLSERMGRCPTVLSKAFAKGDIKLSTLGDICDELGIRCVWQWVRPTPNPEEERTEEISDDNYEVWEAGTEHPEGDD